MTCNLYLYKSLHKSQIIQMTVLISFFSKHLPQKLSLGRARELSVHTARLPIDEYMVKKSNAKNFHSKILAVNQGELTVLIGKTSEYVINMNSPFPLSLSSCSVWYFADTLHHRQLDRSPTSMVPASQGLCYSTSCFSTAASFSIIASTCKQWAVLSASYFCQRKSDILKFIEK